MLEYGLSMDAHQISVNPQVLRHTEKVETDSWHQSVWACLVSSPMFGVLHAYALQASPVSAILLRSISGFSCDKRPLKLKRWAAEWKIAAELDTGAAAGGLDSRYEPRTCSGAPALAAFGFLRTHTHGSNGPHTDGAYVGSFNRSGWVGGALQPSLCSAALPLHTCAHIHATSACDGWRDASP